MKSLMKSLAVVAMTIAPAMASAQTWVNDNTDNDINLCQSAYPVYCTGNPIDFYAAKFACFSTEELVDEFNSLIGNTGFNNLRAAHDKALIKEFMMRGINVYAVYDGRSIHFAHHVELRGNTLVTID